MAKRTQQPAQAGFDVLGKDEAQAPSGFVYSTTEDSGEGKIVSTTEDSGEGKIVADATRSRLFVRVRALRMVLCNCVAYPVGSEFNLRTALLDERLKRGDVEVIG